TMTLRPAKTGQNADSVPDITLQSITSALFVAPQGPVATYSPGAVTAQDPTQRTIRSAKSTEPSRPIGLQQALGRALQRALWRARQGALQWALRGAPRWALRGALQWALQWTLQ